MLKIEPTSKGASSVGISLSAERQDQLAALTSLYAANRSRLVSALIEKEFNARIKKISEYDQITREVNGDA